MYIKIKSSKTDPFRSGCVIRLAAIPGHKLCPVRAMKAFLSLRGMGSGPLFVFGNGKFLTRSYVVSFLQITLPGVPNICTHSFRIGGASAALSAGAPDAMIRVMGRWSSDCYLRYIRVSDHQVFNFQREISLAHTTRTWNSDNI